jgi:hypothetical protein
VGRLYESDRFIYHRYSYSFVPLPSWGSIPSHWNESKETMAELYLSSFTEGAKTALGVLIVCLLCRVLYHIIYSAWWHPLAAFPGPFWARITRLWVAWQNYQGKEATTIYELHKKFGRFSLAERRMSAKFCRLKWRCASRSGGTHHPDDALRQ